VKTAIAYYTRFGHTTLVARTLQEKLGADLHRIEETKQRGFPAMGFGAILNRRFEIKPMNLDCSGYDLVVLCTPIWAGRPACPTRTFLRDAKLEGRKLAVMFSNNGGDLEKALEIIKKDLAGRNVEIVGLGSAVTQKTTDEELKQAAQGFAQRLRVLSH